MITVKTFVCNMLQENCYVVSDETGCAAIIDCGAFHPEERQAIVNYIKDNDLHPLYLLATHGHLDHNFGNNTVFEQFGLRPCVSAKDGHLMETLKRQAHKFYNMEIPYDFPQVQRHLENYETLKLGNHEIQVIETPGHSKGSVCYYIASEHLLFSGDTLFRHSIGRTDFAEGSMFMIINSLRQLAQLPDNVKVLPGHGGETTIGEELAHNPYMGR